MSARCWWREGVSLAALLTAVLLVPACTGTPTGEPPPATTAGAAPADPAGVVEAHDTLMSALRAGDAAALEALLDRSGGTLLFHPRVQPRFDDPGEIRKDFGRMIARLGSAEWTEVHRSVRVVGEVGWHTSHLALESGSLAEPFLGRATEIWVRQPEGWRLAHAHWSENPR